MAVDQATLDPTKTLKRLTHEEVQRYHDEGYVRPFRIFNDAEVKQNLKEFDRLTALLKPGEDAGHINCWERTDPFLYSLCANPKILDCVEDILGPDVMLWSTHCFCKYPGDGKDVSWHQDARYWPLKPHKNVTVWLAFDDSDAGNGAMKVIPGTHRLGIVAHEDDVRPDNALWLKVKPSEIDETKARHVTLKAGEISLHDDNVVHGSDKNTSTRRRCGLTMRYCTPDVKCDLKVWPNFQTRLFRGVDRYDLNPHWAPTFAV